MQDLGVRIRELRLARGLSQSELGQGRYSGSYISHIESGRRIPSPEVLQFLAERLRMPIAQLDPNDSEAADADAAGWLSSARRYMVTRQWDDALRCAQQARTIAERLGRQGRVWEAELVQAKVYGRAGYFEQAADQAKRLADDTCVGMVPTLKAEAHILAAHSYRQLGRLTEAATEANNAIHLADRLDVDLEASALIELLGAVVNSPDRINTQPIEERLEMLIDDLTSAEATNVARSIASAAFARGDERIGLAMLERGLTLCDVRTDPRTWASLNLALARAIVDSEGGDLRRAKACLEAAWPVISLTASPGETVGIRLVRARYALRSGDAKAALEQLEILARQADVAGDLIFQAEVARSMADALLVLDRVTEGRAQLQRAAGLFERASAHQRALDVWHRFASIG